MSRSEEDVKRDMRALRADPGQVGARAALQRLMGELARLRQADDVAVISRPEVKPRRRPDSLSDADAAAVATWPREMRSRLHRSAMSKIIDDGLSGTDARDSQH